MLVHFRISEYRTFTMPYVCCPFFLAKSPSLLCIAEQRLLLSDSPPHKATSTLLPPSCHTETVLGNSSLPQHLPHETPFVCAYTYINIIWPLGRNNTKDGTYDNTLHPVMFKICLCKSNQDCLFSYGILTKRVMLK